MPLWFHNVYTDTVYIAVLWYDNTCQPTPWRKIGWWHADPGAIVETIPGDLREYSKGDVIFAWFAATGVHGPSWSGTNSRYFVPTKIRFDQCYDKDDNCDLYCEFRTGQFGKQWFGLTIALLAPGNADQINQGCAWGIPLYSLDPKIHLTVENRNPNPTQFTFTGDGWLPGETVQVTSSYFDEAGGPYPQSGPRKGEGYVVADDGTFGDTIYVDYLILRGNLTVTAQDTFGHLETDTKLVTVS